LFWFVVVVVVSVDVRSVEPRLDSLEKGVFSLLPTTVDAEIGDVLDFLVAVFAQDFFLVFLEFFKFLSHDFLGYSRRDGFDFKELVVFVDIGMHVWMVDFLDCWFLNGDYRLKDRFGFSFKDTDFSVFVGIEVEFVIFGSDDDGSFENEVYATDGFHTFELVVGLKDESVAFAPECGQVKDSVHIELGKTDHRMGVKPTTDVRLLFLGNPDELLIAQLYVTACRHFDIEDDILDGVVFDDKVATELFPFVASFFGFYFI
jgi:hypothetical protein